MKYCRRFFCSSGFNLRVVFSVIVLVFLLFSALPKLHAQTEPVSDRLDKKGDSAVAERYAKWANDTIIKGQWSAALAGLERAADFSDVSSDISYLLALARSHEKKDRGSVLQALNKAFYIDNWHIYGPESARLLKAENLIAIKAYREAMAELSMVRSSPEQAVLTLKALYYSKDGIFHRFITETLDRYPRETGPARILFEYLSNEVAAGRNPGGEDIKLLELVIRRLPVLLLTDPDLAWMAAPFMRDGAEAKRQIQAYRAVNTVQPESLPA